MADLLYTAALDDTRYNASLNRIDRNSERTSKKIHGSMHRIEKSAHFAAHALGLGVGAHLAHKALEEVVHLTEKYARANTAAEATMLRLSRAGDKVGLSVGRAIFPMLTGLTPYLEGAAGMFESGADRVTNALYGRGTAQRLHKQEADTKAERQDRAADMEERNLRVQELSARGRQVEAERQQEEIRLLEKRKEITDQLRKDEITQPQADRLRSLNQRTHSAILGRIARDQYSDVAAGTPIGLWNNLLGRETQRPVPAPHRAALHKATRRGPASKPPAEPPGSFGGGKSDGGGASGSWEVEEKHAPESLRILKDIEKNTRGIAAVYT